MKKAGIPLAGMYIYMILVGMTITVFSPMIQDIQNDFGVTKTSMGQFTALVFIGGIAGLFLMMLLTDKLGSLAVFIASCVLSGVMFIAMAHTGSFGALLAVSLPLGAAIKVADGAPNSLIADRFPEKILSYTNLLHFFVSGGCILAPFLIASLKTRGVSWRYFNHYLGIAFLVLLVMYLAMWMPGSRRVEKPKASSQKKLSSSWMKDKEIYGMFILIFLYCMHQLGLTTWTAVFFSSLPIKQIIADSSASILWIGILAGRLLVSRFSEGQALRWLVRGALISGVVLTVTFIIGQPHIILVMYIVTGLLTGAVVPTMIARTNRRFPGNTGSATMFLFIAMMVGQAFVSYVMGSFADHFGIAAAMYFSSIPLIGIYLVGKFFGLTKQ